MALAHGDENEVRGAYNSTLYLDLAEPFLDGSGERSVEPDAILQIHGGNGYALEFEISRVLCDACILNIFEGAAEIQAQVIAKWFLGARN